MSDRHTFPVRVYYEDTDFSGNVYHAAYLKFMERGRTEFLRSIGVSHAELHDRGIAFAVRSMQIAFEGAAHIDDALNVETRVEGVSGARLKLHQRITRGPDVLATASVLVVAIRELGGAARLPAALRERLVAKLTP